MENHENRIKDESKGAANATRVAGFDPASLRPRPNTSLGLVQNKEATAPQGQAAAAPSAPAEIDPNDLAPNDIRLQPGYAEWYYAQNPRDPRYPAPLVSYSRFSAQQHRPNNTPPPLAQGAPNNGAPQQQGFDGTAGSAMEQQQRMMMMMAEQMRANAVAQAAASQQQQQQQPGGMDPDQLNMAAYYNQQQQGGTGNSPFRAGLDPLAALSSNPIAAAAAIASSNPLLAMQLAAQLTMYSQPNQNLGGLNPALLLALTQQAAAQQQQMGYGFPPSPNGGFGGMAGYGDNMQGYGDSRGGFNAYGQYNNSNAMMSGGFDGRGRGRGGRGGGGGGGGFGGGSRGGGRGMGGGSGYPSGSGGPRSVARSPFLDQFRLNNTSMKLGECMEHIDELARDQEGSRFLQRMLENPGVSCSAEELDQLFHAVVKDPLPLMKDVFGNYVIQKMLDIGNEAQIHLVAQSIFGSIVDLTLQTYGCRVIQRAIHSFSTADRQTLFEELRESIPVCVQDQNGNHVIQKCIEELPVAGDYIIRSFIGRVHEFATHAYGCRVIQCILVHCPHHEPTIVPEVFAHLDALTCDQFGNYVVQHLITDGRDPTAVNQLVEHLIPNFYTYSVHKFASNVMEKVFLKVSSERKSQIVDYLMAHVAEGHPDGTPSQLVAIMCDQFGNYVTQRIMEHASETQMKAMAEHVRHHVSIMRKYTYGKHILSRLERQAQVHLGGGSVHGGGGGHGGGRGHGGHGRQGGNAWGGDDAPARGGRGGGRGGHAQAPQSGPAWGNTASEYNNNPEPGAFPPISQQNNQQQQPQQGNAFQQQQQAAQQQQQQQQQQLMMFMQQQAAAQQQMQGGAGLQGLNPALLQMMMGGGGGGSPDQGGNQAPFTNYYTASPMNATPNAGSAPTPQPNPAHAALMMMMMQNGIGNNGGNNTTGLAGFHQQLQQQQDQNDGASRYR